MIKIAFTVAMAAVALTAAPLLIGTFRPKPKTSRWRKPMFRSVGTATTGSGADAIPTSPSASAQAASPSARGDTAAR